MFVSHVKKTIYSGVNVYECNINGNFLMKRCHDQWMNATQILKIAELDKPRRTRILEKFAQKGLHEKVQGGCGKYQGTWVPLERALELAQEFDVYSIISPLLEYSESHMNSAHLYTPQSMQKPSNKSVSSYPSNNEFCVSQPSSESYSSQELPSAPRMPELSNSLSLQPNVSQSSILSSVDFNDALGLKEVVPNSKHYSQALLDYFLLSNNTQPPDFVYERPPDWDVNASIDEDGHTALHWAAAMGNLEMMHALLQAEANVVSVNYLQQTSLMRCVMFTMNYDLQTFELVSELLQSALCMTDSFGQTVFHHIALLASSKSKMEAARYYMDILLQNLTSTQSVEVATQILNVQDDRGDTALLICARNGAKKCARLLMAFYACATIPNNQGQYPSDFLTSKEMEFPLEQEATKGFFDDITAEGALRSSTNKHPSFLKNSLMKNALPNVLSRIKELTKYHESSLSDKQTTFSLATEVLEQTVRESETSQRLWNEATHNEPNFLSNQRNELKSTLLHLLELMRAATYQIETFQALQLSKYVSYFSQIWGENDELDLVGSHKISKVSSGSRMELEKDPSGHERQRMELGKQLAILQKRRKEKIKDILDMISLDTMSSSRAK
ncbi:MBF transcription factor complex subunit Res1 [Schizosaccharomyces cryophilus OY26]|uniref:MBF transcription factor complex subunit Res1 n=1 Tax=Schizosaccharomyces cryophilus (strain OY26 / ATCC MYA-4695 / CBS 11777 / NBRC 106824 / NRRL Y48691) TaxID=653667 RepID=S9VT96_SCHCR|nr:MBF transcription factor complex subunit Res1 [Schizosaccharomyces cryophilus OY26]EPY49329.1 MBF transcription factor complex subunit Res1 [Schizosaccharomyces cryophilus OY26]